MKLTFSQRMGLEPIPDRAVLQTRTIDNRLKHDLWNAFYGFIFNQLPVEYSNFIGGGSYIVDWGEDLIDELMDELDLECFDKTIDGRDYRVSNSQEALKHYFIKKANWSCIYNFIEFFCNASSFPRYNASIQADYIEECNRVLQKNCSGFRIIDNLVTPITTESEIASIEEAVKSPYEYANQHLHSALAKLSNRDNPDYRNSIKESISAVESICRKLTGESTLDRALNKIGNKIDFNSQFKQGLEKLYHYTNGESGIRHALIDEGQSSFDEAKFMLVACSAFVNYLTAKASVLND